MTFTESVVEQAALAWLETLGYVVKHGVDIAPDTPGAERADYGQVMIEDRLRQTLVRLNPALPAEAIEDAFRKLTRPEGPTLDVRNRAVHRLLVDGVTVEYRTPEGGIRGAQAQVIDYDEPENNDWLAVNQFTVTENLPAATGAAQAGRESKQKRLQVFRLESVRAGFKKAWQERDYATIITVARKIPENVLQEDPKLLMWYDQALTRTGGE